MAVHLAKGTRDFLPAQMNNRLKVIDTVRKVFLRFGFEPLETPTIERIETLTGKYGDEGEHLIFRILKRGAGAALGEVDMGLRYDLTVPLARVVAMNQGLPMPFKRYQIQPVWRAERPQKGRFREFYQCDVDTVGCESMVADAECVAVVDAALSELGFTDFTVRVNHRKILRAITEAIGEGERETMVLVAVDKLDKIGRDGVTKELLGKGVSQESLDQLWDILSVGSGWDALGALGEKLGESGQAAIAELGELRENAEAMGVNPARVTFDPTLARGLSYYTGPVFETVIHEGGVGSVSGGGRYDGLVGMFSGRNVPAVGVSLGLERIIVVMEEMGMLTSQASNTEVLVTVFSAETRSASLEAVGALRAAGVPAQVYLQKPGKLGKQFKHATKLGCTWAVTIGPDEAAAGMVQLKNLEDRTQETLTLAEAVAKVQG